MKKLIGTILATVLAGVSCICPMPDTALATDFSQEDAVSTVLAQLSTDEKQQFDFITKKLGFEDTEDYLSKLDLTRDNFPLTNRLKDINGNNSIDVGDIISLSGVLDGKAKFAYNYACLDVTGESIIDLGDVQAFTDYLSYILLGLITIPNNIACYGTNPLPQNGTMINRQYMKHIYGANDSILPNDPSNCNTTYYLWTSALPNTSTYSTMFLNDYLDSVDESVLSTREDDPPYPYPLYPESDDPRVLLTSGTASVIGKHQLLACAHELFKTENNVTTFNTCTPHAYQYLSNGSTLETSLTVTAYHVPMDYITAITEDSEIDPLIFDYAIIEVAEDLEYLYFNSTYPEVNLGKFNFGLSLKPAEENTLAAHISAFPMIPPEPDRTNLPEDFDRYFCYATGTLVYRSPYSTLYKLCHNMMMGGGSSGAAVCTTTTYSNVNYESIVGTSTSGLEIIDNPSLSIGFGMRIILPILHFVSNNPYLTTT